MLRRYVLQLMASGASIAGKIAAPLCLIRSPLLMKAVEASAILFRNQWRATAYDETLLQARRNRMAWDEGLSFASA